MLKIGQVPAMRALDIILFCAIDCPNGAPFESNTVPRILRILEASEVVSPQNGDKISDESILFFIIKNNYNIHLLLHTEHSINL